jgi:hypothetical protein
MPDVLLFNWTFMFNLRVSFFFMLAIISVKDYYIRCFCYSARFKKSNTQLKKSNGKI